MFGVSSTTGMDSGMVPPGGLHGSGTSPVAPPGGEAPGGPDGQVSSAGLVIFSQTPPVGLTRGNHPGVIVKMHGVGFKAHVQEGWVLLGLGYSHFLGRRLPRGGRLRTQRQSLAVEVFARGGPAGFVQQLVALRPANPFTRRGVYPADKVPTIKEGKKR